MCSQFCFLLFTTGTAGACGFTQLLVRITWRQVLACRCDASALQNPHSSRASFLFQFGDLTSMSPTLLDKGMEALWDRGWITVGGRTLCWPFHFTLLEKRTFCPRGPPWCWAFPFADHISDLGSEVDTDSRSVGEPLVKRERSDTGHSLQEIWHGDVAVLQLDGDIWSQVWQPQAWVSPRLCY